MHYFIPVFLLGLIFGSFFNVVIYRTPIFLDGKFKNKKQASLLNQLAWPASFCTSCKAKIEWFDNIPVLSWLNLKGRCRHCRQTIKIRYFIVELFTAFIFSYSFLKFGFSYTTIYWIALFSILVILFFIDLETYYLPDLFTFTLILLALVGSYLEITQIAIADALVGAVIGFFVLYAVNFLYKLARKVDGFGGGDFKLLAGLGALFGWPSVLIIIGTSSILGLVCILLITTLKQKKIQLNSMLPFGPFLILSGLIMYADTYLNFGLSKVYL
jgi:leader peptidase (prepilin peptidase)/N-methyltransferase